MALTFTPFQHALQITIDDKPIDYLLTVDETGHVYEAKPMVFELPETAQRLVLGETDEQLEKKIYAFAGLFKYLLPLSLANQIEAFKTAFEPLVQEIYHRLTQKGLEGLDLSVASAPDAVASKIYRFYQSHQEPERKILSLWKNIENVFEYYRKMEPSYFLDKISKEVPEITADFFPAIIPFLGLSGKSSAFEYLGRTGLAHIKTYLLKELAQPFSRHYAIGILKGLLAYEEKEEHIYKTVIEFYGREKKLDVFTTDSLVKIIAKYPTSRTKEICHEVMLKAPHPASTTAASALLKMNVPPQDIMDVVLPRFHAADPEVSESAFTVLSLEEVPVEYLPEVNTIFDVYIHILSKRYNGTIVHAANQLFSKLSILHLSTQICSYLKNGSVHIQRGMLALVKCLFDTYPIEHEAVQPYITEKMSKAYLSLATNQSISITAPALHLIAHLGMHEGKEEFVAPLLDIYQGEFDVLIRNEVLNAINHILFNIEYPPELEPIYLDALESSNPNLRVYALWGLRFSPNKDLKKYLLKYKDDPNKKIRAIAEQLLHRPTKGSPWG